LVLAQPCSPSAGARTLPGHAVRLSMSVWEAVAEDGAVRYPPRGGPCRPLASLGRSLPGHSGPESSDEPALFAPARDPRITRGAACLREFGRVHDGVLWRKEAMHDEDRSGY
jgi:hypothetical protein